MVKDLHQIVKKQTHVLDPYKTIKERDIKMAKKIYPTLQKLLESKDDKLYWALKISAIGNIIDSAVDSDVDYKSCIGTELTKDFSVCDIGSLRDTLNHSKRILIIGDNSGESIFDKALLSYLNGYDIFYCVRSEPIINDVTFDDALNSGINHFATIVSSGCSAPGTILEQCHPEFLTLLKEADIVISKGQGNFEALSDCQRPIFYLLKTKCSMIAERLEVNLGSYVLKFRNP